MGYGEFGGGGSVDWIVVHSDKKQKGKDKDPDPPKGSGGKFYVLVDHSIVLTLDTDGHDVMVVWSPTTVDEAIADANQKKKASA